MAAATGLPTLLLTAALVVVGCFWLLVAVGLAPVGSFDEDADLGRLGLGGIPVAVALSLLTATSWSLSVGTTSVLAVALPSGPTSGVLRLTLPLASLLVAWWLTRLAARALHRRGRPAGATDGPDRPGAARGGNGVRLGRGMTGARSRGARSGDTARCR
ncbi:hypothetical protein [Streptomyces sp. NPDC098781]|uniref:hypothetical protein n=1 Tax=Streptomyces sp. NPDC098781 TaxID=3366097 RepID=UPI003829DA73